MLIRGLFLILATCFIAISYAGDECRNDDIDPSHIHFRTTIYNNTSGELEVTGRDAKKRGATKVPARSGGFCISHFREWTGSGKPEAVKQNLLLTWKGETPGFCYIEIEFKKIEVSEQGACNWKKRRMIVPNSSKARVIAQSGSERIKCSVTDFVKSFGEPQCKDDLEVRVTVEKVDNKKTGK